MKAEPALSIVVIVHHMREQALRTLYSLSADHQRTDPDRYEVVVVENDSPQPLAADEVAAFGPQFRHHLRAEPSSSPAAACNAGVALARGGHIALMIDGARMVTPGVVPTTLAAIAMRPDAVLAVPGYHLGRQLQRDPRETGHDEAAETALLASIGWPADGYALFGISVLSGSCANGYLVPIAETNFLCLSRELWQHLGGVSEEFRTPGGGFVNLDLYRRAVESGSGPLWLLPGEGTFHQFHSGVTTGKRGLDRDRLMADLVAEYERIRGEPFRAPALPPVLFGTVGPAAAGFLRHSAQQLVELGSQS